MPETFDMFHNMTLQRAIIFLYIRPVGWIMLRGVLLCFGRYFLALEALTRAPKARASRGSGGMPPMKFCKFRFSQVPFPAF